MGYYFNNIVDMNFENAVERVTEELKKKGFGILTEIDVRDTLKKKLDVEFRKYKILGACNPPFAYKALSSERMIGAMLPCNVIVQEADDGRTEVAVVDPVASMMAVENSSLECVSKEVRDKLRKVIESL